MNYLIISHFMPFNFDFTSWFETSFSRWLYDKFKFNQMKKEKLWSLISSRTESFEIVLQITKIYHLNYNCIFWLSAYVMNVCQLCPLLFAALTQFAAAENHLRQLDRNHQSKNFLELPNQKSKDSDY